VTTTLDRLMLLLRAPSTAVWFVLVAMTLLSYWLGTGHGLDSDKAVAVLLLLISLVKVRFVGLYFMELRDAPIWLRSVFEGYCLVAVVVLITLYLTL
jgi:hypothetical protein